MTPVVEANGARIPLVGLGTWDLRGRTCARIVEQALRLGYRHIDTAEMYDNEREVGEGLRASGVKRDEVFVTTKVWPSHFAPRELERAAKDSLVKLRLPEVDLLLLHWPNPQIPLSETLGALCKVKRGGLARHIGVSNFNVALIEEAVRLSTRAAGLQSDRDASVSRPVEGGRRLPRAWAWRSSPTARSRAATPRTTRCSRASARRTARPPRRSACAGSCSRTSSVIPRTSKIERLEENLVDVRFRADRRRDERDRRRSRAAAAGSSTASYSGSPKWD